MGGRAAPHWGPVADGGVASDQHRGEAVLHHREEAAAEPGPGYSGLQSVSILQVSSIQCIFIESLSFMFMLQCPSF